MIKGRGGIFDVKVDGKLVYSKHATGTFPEHDPLIRDIEKLVK
jgi:selT/selW/selH-like putative selenoprotein